MQKALSLTISFLSLMLFLLIHLHTAFAFNYDTSCTDDPINFEYNTAYSIPHKLSQAQYIDPLRTTSINNYDGTYNLTVNWSYYPPIKSGDSIEYAIVYWEYDKETTDILPARTFIQGISGTSYTIANIPLANTISIKLSRWEDNGSGKHYISYGICGPYQDSGGQQTRYYYYTFPVSDEGVTPTTAPTPEPPRVGAYQAYAGMDLSPNFFSSGKVDIYYCVDQNGVAVDPITNPEIDYLKVRVYMDVDMSTVTGIFPSQPPLFSYLLNAFINKQNFIQGRSATDLSKINSCKSVNQFLSTYINKSALTGGIHTLDIIPYLEMDGYIYPINNLNTVSNHLTFTVLGPTPLPPTPVPTLTLAPTPTPQIIGTTCAYDPNFYGDTSGQYTNLIDYVNANGNVNSTGNYCGITTYVGMKIPASCYDINNIYDENPINNQMQNFKYDSNNPPGQYCNDLNCGNEQGCISNYLGKTANITNYFHYTCNSTTNADIKDITYCPYGCSNAGCYSIGGGTPIPTPEPQNKREFQAYTGIEFPSSFCSTNTIDLYYCVQDKNGALDPKTDPNSGNLFVNVYLDGNSSIISKLRNTANFTRTEDELNYGLQPSFDRAFGDFINSQSLSDPIKIDLSGIYSCKSNNRFNTMLDINSLPPAPGYHILNIVTFYEDTTTSYSITNLNPVSDQPFYCPALTPIPTETSDVSRGGHGFSADIGAAINALNNPTPTSLISSLCLARGGYCTDPHKGCRSQYYSDLNGIYTCPNSDQGCCLPNSKQPTIKPVLPISTAAPAAPVVQSQFAPLFYFYATD